MYSLVVDSAFEVSLALHRTTTWRWRLAERHVRLTVRRLKQGDDDNDVAAVHQPLGGGSSTARFKDVSTTARTAAPPTAGPLLLAPLLAPPPKPGAPPLGA